MYDTVVNFQDYRKRCGLITTQKDQRMMKSGILLGPGPEQPSCWGTCAPNETLRVEKK